MHIRPATRADVPALQTLIDASIRGIGSTRYSPAQVESSLRYLFGVDTQLIDDGTYFVVEAEGGIVAAGGWSRRKTPFGGDQATAVQDVGLRNPATAPAVIRAFYVHPDWTRRGLGRLLLNTCEAAAWAEGFRWYELVSTRTGLPLYTALGYTAGEPLDITLPDGVVIEAVRMTRRP